MPEIKHQFTGGKMNKDMDERLVPNGEYRDAMNIQVSTSEGSDVGTIQNILGNTIGCANNTDSYIQDGSQVVGSVADEKNDSLYWLVSGPGDAGGQQLAVDETASLKDLIVRLDVSSQLCDPIFVDNYSFCVGIPSSFNNFSNSIIISDNSLYAQVTAGMTATGYGNNINLFGPTPVIGIGNITTLAINYYNDLDFTGTSFTPPPIVISDATNTTMYIRGFWNDTTQDYTNIHYDSTVDTTNAPISQANLPPDGASQFWIPMSDLPGQHNITIGSTIQNIGAQAYHAFNGGANVLNNFNSITVNDIFLGQVIHPFNFQPIQAWIITVGDPLGPDAPLNRVHNCWSDSNGAQFGCGFWTGIWQKAASITMGTQSRDALPFYELEATIVPIGITTYTSAVNNNIWVAGISHEWLDDIYNSFYDASGALIAGQQLQINNNIGSGMNFPPNSCIDPASVIDYALFDVAAGIYDSEFAIIDCDTGLGLAPGAITPNTTGRPITFNIIGDALEGVILNQVVNMGGVDTVCFESGRSLNFEHDRLITGIDILDDVLLWTDNFTEPKKINITRSAQGTDSGGEIHTAIVNQDAGHDLVNDYNPIGEEHITVIRKTPKNALNLELSDGRDPSLSYAGRTNVGVDAITTSIISSSNSTVNNDFSSLHVGDRVSFFVTENHLGNTSMDFAWEEGGYLLLKEFTNGIAPNVPLANWTIRGLITESPLNSFENISASFVQVEIEVVGMNGTPGSPDPAVGALDYTVDLEDTEPVIFEDKFPRFSYRYKYEDGEHSTFAPWSEVAFSPSVFDYEPKAGWNTGMLNNLKSIKVKGFHKTTWGSPLGKDVVEVDILYKEDSSPNIYLVQTISPVDILTSQNTTLPWYSNEYLINSETIKGIIPSNQLLRPWDNVPKKALAQSISGNRVIYANYEQNYDLKINGYIYKPDFGSSLTAWAPPISAVPRKSIKSLRDYKLGVVFADKYGRETPVLIGENGGFRVEKHNSIDANRLSVKLKGQAPLEMAYYKFYIKETSNEYYNLAMDRWYNAEDGNIWLAFPSSDRNKMDLDTSLYFKRGAEGDHNVIENSTKYKVLAIENEAPEFIKTRRIRIGAVAHYAGTAAIFGTPADPLEAAPYVGGVSFTMDYAQGGFYGTSLSKMEDIKEDIYMQFVSSSDYSDQYKISEITSDFDATASPAPTNPLNYFVTLDTSFKGDINFIFDNAASPSTIVDDIKVVFTKAVVENKPKFDGRFFAKIENDGKIQTQITDDAVGVNYIDIAYKTVYALEDDDKLRTVSQSALYEPQSTSNIAYNYITLDYGAHPSVTLDDGPSGRNPGGLNFNQLAARETYFFDATSWKTVTTIGGNLTSPMESLHIYRKKESNALKDMGVWFIDRSTKKYEVNTAGVNDNEFKWLDQNNMNDLYIPECMDAAACGYTGVAGEIGNGITHDVANDNSFIELGFGGFDDPIKADWKPRHANDGCGIHHYTQTSWDTFYGVGMDNPKWNDALTTKFVGGLSAGFIFRWKEDPTETIYKIEGQTSYQRNLRFGRIDEGLFCDQSYLHANDEDATRLLIEAPSSYTKTFGFKVTPSMDGWDPSAPVGTYSGQAGMMNGLKLGDGILTPTTTVATAVSSLDVVITLSDVTFIKVGMSVGMNTNIPLLSKVISVDVANSKITISLAATGSIVVNAPFRSGFQIRVVEEHMFGLAGNPGLPRQNYIVVDNITTECSNGNTLKPMYSLHKGMKLHAYNLDSSVDLAHDVIIKEIEQHASGWKLTLAGYQNPMNTTNATGNLSVDFVIGEKMKFYQVSMNGASNYTELNTDARQVNAPKSDDTVPHELGRIGAVGYDMVFMEAIDEYSDGGNLPENPFVWETEPKKDNDLDIYYEISENNPTELNTKTIKAAIPQESTVVGVSGNGGSWGNVRVISNSFASGQEIQVSDFFWVGPGLASDGTIPLAVGDILMITKPNGIQFSVKVAGWTPDLTNPTIARIIKLSPSLSNAEHNLNWHNCYSFGNGVESNRIKDTFNSPFISNGVKASTTLDGGYKKERRKTGLIYSGIYNSTSGVNNLNQFIQAEKITKDVNPIYGSIQKLHSRSTADGDLIVLCEDRILKILANKDALYNADGNPQLTASNNVLGQTVPFGGNFGISKNPESFASESYRAYFTDKVRGAVVRLSKDGLTAISNHGMKDWFRDNLKLNSVLTGSHDDKKSEYNITLKQVVEAGDFPSGLTVSFREDVRGWVSFKSFVPDHAISCANEYYTFKGATPWLHHVEKFDYLGKEVGRNTFYNIPKDSSFNVILNDAPGSVKSFNTISYEGSQSKVTPFLINPTTGLSDGEYYNLHSKKGWHVDHIFTNKEVGTVSEFIEKEGKWFNYIKGKQIQLAGQYLLPGETLNPKPLSNFDLSSFSIQGLGKLKFIPLPTTVAACTDATAINYDPNAVVDDGSCIYPALGCTNPTANNYNSSANTDDGSCYWLGCTDATATNYDATATLDDGSCIATVNGCTDPTAANYNPLANVDNGTCVPFIYGCTDATAVNYDSTANTDDGSCVATVSGCTDPSYIEYNAFANVDDGSCITLIVNGCTDNTAINWDPSANVDDGTCISTVLGCMDDGTLTGSIYYPQVYSNYNPLATIDDGTCIDCVYGCTQAMNSNFNAAATCDDNTCALVTSGCTDCGYVYEATLAHIPYYCNGVSAATAPGPINYNSVATIDDGSCVYFGCTDPLANNYGFPGSSVNGPNGNFTYLNGGAVDDGSCTFGIGGCMDGSTLCGGAYAYSNYNSLATVDDGSCIFAGGCPVLTTYVLTTNLPANNVALVVATYNVGGTIYSDNLGNNGVPIDLTVTRVVVGNDGTMLYTQPNQQGWTNAGSCTKKQNQPFLTSTQVIGLTSILSHVVLYTNDGSCTVSRSDTYTIGCNDITATNYVSVDILDVTQCTY